MNRTDITPPRAGRSDALSGVLLRILFLACAALLAAWAAGNRPVAGAALGGALALLCIRSERRILPFFRIHREGIVMAALFIYVVILGIAAYSEICDCGWFDWLPG